MTSTANKKHRWIFWLGVSTLAFTFIALVHSILLPFILGMLIAYFIHPAADRMEKWGLSRTVSTLILMIGFFSTIIALLLLIVPILASQLTGLIAAMPEYVNDFNAHYARQFNRWIGGLPDNYLDNIKDAASNMSGVMVKFTGDFLTGLFHSGMAFVNVIMLIVLTPVVTFYLLRDWDGIVKHIDSLLPRAHLKTIREQFVIINRTLAGFVRGQLNVCLLLGLYYAIGLSLVGLKFGIVIGFGTGMMVILPYVGQTLGAVIGVGVALFQFEGYVQAGEVLAVFLTGQIVESNFLTPKLVGEKVGLHPVWIIFGMLTGAALFGFVGVLLAVPLTAVIGVLIRFATDQYLQSTYYKGK